MPVSSWLRVSLLLLATVAAGSRPLVAQQAAPLPLEIIGTREGLAAAQVTALAPARAGGMWVATPRGLQMVAAGRAAAELAAESGRPVPDPRITVLLADPKDGLWIGTYGGLVQHAGTRWRCLARERGLPDPRVTAAAWDRAGRLWVGTWRGACFGAGERFAVPGGLPAALVVDLCPDSSGSVWVATAHAGWWRCTDQACAAVGWTGRDSAPALVRLRTASDGAAWAATSNAGVWRCAPGESRAVATGLTEARPRDLLADGDSSMLVATQAGLAHCDPQGCSMLPALAGTDLHRLWRDASGAVWIGSAGRGLWRWQAGQCTRASLAADSVRAIGEDRRGRLWVSTERGLWNQRGSGWERHPGVPAAWSPQAVLVDADDQVWGATTDRGLLRIRGQQAVCLTPETSLPEAPITSLVAARDGLLWIGTRAGLVRHDGEFFELWPSAFAAALLPAAASEDGFGPLSEVQALAPAPDGTLWIGHAGGLAWRSPDEPDRWRRAVLPELGGVAVRALAAGGGSVWVGTDDGLLQVRGERVHRYTAAAGLPQNRIHALAWDPRGRLWIGTSAGLAVLQEGRIRTLTREHGLPSELVFCLHVDRRGGVWVGTMGAGAARYDGRSFFPVDARRGLPSNIVRAIQTDASGHVWFGTDKGVARLPADAAPRGLADRWRWPALAGALAAGAAAASLWRRRGRTRPATPPGTSAAAPDGSELGARDS